MRGPETEKSHSWRAHNGFYRAWMVGKGIDVGYGGPKYIPVLDSAYGIEKHDWIQNRLQCPTESQDYVYSSHCMEHVWEPVPWIRECFRVIKLYGFFIIIVPHRDLYEKRRQLPSRFNPDHKKFYTPAVLLDVIERALPIANTWRLVQLYDNDLGFDYSLPPEKHSTGCYEIVCVIQKIKMPDWELDNESL